MHLTATLLNFGDNSFLLDVLLYPIAEPCHAAGSEFCPFRGPFERFLQFAKFACIAADIGMRFLPLTNKLALRLPRCTAE